MVQETMLYSRYKKHYLDCKILSGSYNKNTKTIVVLVPDGRMKKSGVRGKKFHGYELWFINQKGERKYCTYRAVSLENAEKQHKKYCKEMGWIPCEPPEGKIAHIY